MFTIVLKFLKTGMSDFEIAVHFQEVLVLPEEVLSVEQMGTCL
jgi:hypothetical protein